MTELLCPPVHYTGEFATISKHDDIGRQFTYWWFGEPKWHANGSDFDKALACALRAGWDWATDAMKIMFEQDVITAGE